MNFKEKVSSGQLICGTHIHLSDTCVTEIAPALGYDFLWVNMEHTTLSCEQVHMHLLVARSAGTPVGISTVSTASDVLRRYHEMGINNMTFIMLKISAVHCAVMSILSGVTR